MPNRLSLNLSFLLLIASIQSFCTQAQEVDGTTTYCDQQCQDEAKKKANMDSMIFAGWDMGYTPPIYGNYPEPDIPEEPEEPKNRAECDAKAEKDFIRCSQLVIAGGFLGTTPCLLFGPFRGKCAELVAAGAAITALQCGSWQTDAKLACSRQFP